MQMIQKDISLDDIQYWLYSPGEGASIWNRCCEEGIIAIGWDEIGDLNAFSSKVEIKEAMKAVYDPSKTFRNDAHATWQFVNEMKPGDIVFAKRGLHVIIGCGIVKSDYEFTNKRWDYYNNIRKIEWLQKGEWPHPGRTAMKTLTNITPYKDYVEELKELIETYSVGKNIWKEIEEENIFKIETDKIEEEALERIISSTDPNARWEVVTSSGKKRFYDKHIIDNLKKLYNGCCQICGFNPLEEYNTNICEAHHIDYFSKSQNNDAENIIILCPNHHRLIHNREPAFNRDLMAFVFDDNRTLPVAIDYHLKKKQ